MRDAKTEALLSAVNAAARAARASGVAQESIVYEATAGAFAEPGEGRWPSPAAARRAASSASAAIASSQPKSAKEADRA